MIPLGLSTLCLECERAVRCRRSPGDSALSVLFSELLAGRALVGAAVHGGRSFGHDPQGLVLLTSSVLRHRHGASGAPQGACAAALTASRRSARVDVLCLDKTGTITGRMEVEGTHPLPVEGVGFGVDSDEAAVPVDTTVLDFALANVARATSADANETRQALLNYYADRPVEVSEPLSVIPFSSSKSGAARRLRRAPM